MRDQAAELRQLVLQEQTNEEIGRACGPRLIVVMSGKGGVGTSTLAVNLAVAIEQAGCHAVLVDADLNRADAGTLCRLQGSTTIADVLSSRRKIVEALQTGPAGIGVMPGAWVLGDASECTQEALQRFLAELRTLGQGTQFVVLDIGSGLNRITRGFWHAADRVVAVTSTEPISVMDTYAAIKLSIPSERVPEIFLLINQASDATVGGDALRRLEYVCRQFLKLEKVSGDVVPHDPCVQEAGSHRRPFVLEFPNSPATQNLREIAQRIVQSHPRADTPPARSATKAMQEPGGPRINLAELFG